MASMAQAEALAKTAAGVAAVKFHTLEGCPGLV